MPWYRWWERSENKLWSQAAQHLQTLVEGVGHSEMGSYLLTDLQRFLKLRAKEQEDSFVGLYLAVEEYLVDVCGHDDLSREDLREDMRAQLPDLDQFPLFTMIFEQESRQQVLLCKLLLESVSTCVFGLLGTAGGNVFGELRTWLSEVPDAAGLPVPLLPDAQVPDTPAAWLSLLADLSSAVSELIGGKIGGTAMTRLYDRAYDDLAGRFQKLPAFTAVVSLLPETLVGQDKIAMLSRKQVERVLLGKLDTIQAANQELKRLNDALEKSHAETERLLLSIMPSSVARELKESGQVEPVVYPSTTVLFTDFVGFTRFAAELNPKQLIGALQRAFGAFDAIAERRGLERLKTIGDAYMCAGGLPLSNQTHPIDCVLAGLEMLAVLKQLTEKNQERGLPGWEMRVGVCTGPVVAGVIGKKKFAYDIWGNTVNIAARMESAGVKGAVNISESTRAVISRLFEAEPRGKLPIKGADPMKMYLVRGLCAEYRSQGHPLQPNTQFEKEYRRLSGR